MIPVKRWIPRESGRSTPHERVEGLVQLAAADEHGADLGQLAEVAAEPLVSVSTATNSARRDGLVEQITRTADAIAPHRTDGAKSSTRALSLVRMARSATVFACSACGHESPKWHGRCPGCGEWNTLVEEARGGARRARRTPRRAAAARSRPVPLGDVEAPKVARLPTGIGELDRVLGGGLVPGSLVLIGGSPGIGKSTLTSAALGNLAAAGRKVLYVSGEESAAQVKLRAERLGPHALGVPIVAETDLDAVLATLEAERPEVCVIDSVQVLYDPALTGAPGLGGAGARGRRAG